MLQYDGARSDVSNFSDTSHISFDINRRRRPSTREQLPPALRRRQEHGRKSSNLASLQDVTSGLDPIWQLPWEEHARLSPRPILDCRRQVVALFSRVLQFFLTGSVLLDHLRCIRPSFWSYHDTCHGWRAVHGQYCVGHRIGHGGQDLEGKPCQELGC